MIFLIIATPRYRIEILKKKKSNWKVEKMIQSYNQLTMVDKRQTITIL